MATKGAVPETLLKKRKREEEWAAKRSAAASDSKKKARAGRKDIFKRAETYVKEYRAQVLGSFGLYVHNIQAHCQSGYVHQPECSTAADHARAGLLSAISNFVYPAVSAKQHCCNALISWS